MATVPNPVTWDDDDNDFVPDASDFNTEIRDPINFLVAPKRVMVSNSSNQTVSCDTWEVVSWNNTVTETEAGMHDDSTNNSRLIAITAGWYQVNLVLRWQSQLSGVVQGPRSIMIRKNSNGSVATSGSIEIADDRRRCSEHQTGNFGVASQSCTGYVDLAVNDYVEAFAYQGEQDTITGAAEQDIYHNPPSATVADVRFSMVWIHP